MRREDLIHRLQRSPFRPFRICLTDGARFEIRHPDFVFVFDRSIAHVFEPLSGSVEAQHDYHTIVLHHITRLEPLEPSPSAG